MITRRAKARIKELVAAGNPKYRVVRTVQIAESVLPKDIDKYVARFNGLHYVERLIRLPDSITSARGCVRGSLTRSDMQALVTSCNILGFLQTMQSLAKADADEPTGWAIDPVLAKMVADGFDALMSVLLFTCTLPELEQMGAVVPKAQAEELKTLRIGDDDDGR